MNKLYGTASVNGTQETAVGINTNNWPIPTYMKNRMHNSGCGRCEIKTPQLITWNTSGKYIYVLIGFAQTNVKYFTLKFP